MNEPQSPSTSAGISITAAREVELPSRFIVRSERGLYELSWRWRTHAPAKVFVTSAAGALGAAFMLMHIQFFVLGGVVLAATLAYQLSRWAVGRVYVRAQYGHLDVEHRPIWWPGHSLSLSEIEELFVEEDGRDPKGWSVYAKKKNGERVLLVGMLEDERQARFVERSFEHHLKTETR